MPARRRSGMLLALAGALAAALVPAGTATAAVGSDDFQSAPALLFSVPGSVESTVGYDTQGGSEPVASTGVPPPPCPAMFHTAWWVITGTGQQISLTTAGSSFNTTLAVYDHGGPGGFPLAGNRKACDEDSGPGVLSALSFASIRGRQYLVQVGGSLLSEFGTVAVGASSAVRPANDDRISAQVLQTATPATVSNAGASQELGETLTCAAANYAATIWFRWTSPGVGDAVFSSSAAFGDTVVTVYRAADGAVLGCNAASTATVPLRVAAGDHLIQVGTKGLDVDGLGVGPITTTASFSVDLDLDNDGELDSTDCDDANPAIRHGAVDVPDDGIDQDCDGADAVNLDRDGDGNNRPADCNDANPAIREGAVDVPDDGIDQNCDKRDAVNLDRDRDGNNRPADCNDADPTINQGARDIPGNAIDEDCLDGAAPFPRLESTVRTIWNRNPLRLTRLFIVRAVAASKVELRCRGRGCPFQRKVIKVTKSQASLSILSRDLKRARLKRGAILEVRITLARHVGFMRRITARNADQDPRLQDLCLPVGGGRPRRC